MIDWSFISQIWYIWVIMEQKEQQSKSLSRVSIRLVLVVLESKLRLKLSKLIKPVNYLTLFNWN